MFSVARFHVSRIGQTEPCTARGSIRRRVADGDVARDRGALAVGARARQLRLPFSDGGCRDLGEPEVRRPAMALGGLDRDGAVGRDQRQLALERLLQREHDAQRRALPRAYRRGQHRGRDSALTGGVRRGLGRGWCDGLGCGGSRCWSCNGCGARCSLGCSGWCSRRRWSGFNCSRCSDGCRRFRGGGSCRRRHRLVDLRSRVSGRCEKRHRDQRNRCCGSELAGRIQARPLRHSPSATRDGAESLAKSWRNLSAPG